MAQSPESDAPDSAANKPPRSRPEWVSIVIEFFTMSRTTVILLIAFVLVAGLYSFVRQDPVVAFNSPPRADPTQSETTESDTSGTDTTSTDESTPVEQSTTPTATTDDQDPAGTDASATTSVGPRQFGQDGVEDGQQPTPSATGTQQTQQAPAGQQPQLPQQTAQTQVPTP